MMVFLRDSILRRAYSLPQKQMFVLAFGLIHVIALAVIVTAVHRAPEGYEDETGFHFIEKSVTKQ
jgi:hypothetical protein